MASTPLPDESWRPSRPAPPLLRGIAPEEARPSKPTSTARVLYLLLATVPLVLGGLVVLARAGVLSGEGRAGRVPWDLGVVLIGCLCSALMAGAVAMRAPALHERARGVGFDRREAAIELATLLATIPVSLLLAGASALAWSGHLARVPWAGRDPMAPLVLAALAILVAGAPSAWFSWRSARRTRQMEERFPDLLRDLNESYAAGMTMAQAIRVAGRGDYGRLSDEVRRMAQHVSWGVSFQDALRLFAQRVPTPLVTRAVSLVIKATRAGGDVRDVLAAAARDAREIKTIEAERRTGMALYVIVIYVSFGVFLAVTAALQGLLIPSMLDATRGVPGIGTVVFSAAMNAQDFRFLYFGVGLVQAIGSGLVAGVMSEGRASAGLKHAAVLTGITLVVLGLLL